MTGGRTGRSAVCHLPAHLCANGSLCCTAGNAGASAKPADDGRTAGKPPAGDHRPAERRCAPGGPTRPGQVRCKLGSDQPLRRRWLLTPRLKPFCTFLIRNHRDAWTLALASASGREPCSLLSEQLSQPPYLTRFCRSEPCAEELQPQHTPLSVLLRSKVQGAAFCCPLHPCLA